MVEIAVNSINDKYKDLADILANTDVPDSLTLDTYNEYPIDVSYIDYGYIKHVNGTTKQMFVACNSPCDLKQNMIYMSTNGEVWVPYSFPTEYVTRLYNKLVIYNGDVYLLFDDDVVRLYNFDMVTSSMDIEFIHDDIYDIMINNHELYMLTHNGVYKIGHESSEPEFIEITAEFPFESFVPSLNGDLIILGYGGGYPVFALYDGETHIIFCTTKCQLRTAISYNDKILCYTTDGKVIDVLKTYEMFAAKQTVYEGRNWSGTVTYHHSYFWLCYTENDNAGNAYTIVAKSSNGVNFDPEVQIPHVSEKDGVCCWGDSYTFCICAGSLYMMKSSEKYSDYGFPFIKHFRDIPIGEDGSVEIETNLKISDFDKYVFSPYLCGDAQMKEDTAIQYDITPHFENAKICFKLKAKDYTGLHINAYYYGVLIMY